MNLLEVMQGAADKLKNSIFNEELFKGGISSGYSGGMPSLPSISALDSAQLMQADIGRAGIENEAVNFLQPTPAMSSVGIPSLSSYREPLPPTQPLPPQETERERILREDMERIRRGEPPPIR